MHTSILQQIISAFFTWFNDFQYPWDGGSFTILDYFTACCLIYVFAYFVWNILLFWLPKQLGMANASFWEIKD